MAFILEEEPKSLSHCQVPLLKTPVLLLRLEKAHLQIHVYILYWHLDKNDLHNCSVLNIIITEQQHIHDGIQRYKFGLGQKRLNVSLQILCRLLEISIYNISMSWVAADPVTRAEMVPVNTATMAFDIFCGVKSGNASELQYSYLNISVCVRPTFMLFLGMV